MSAATTDAVAVWPTGRTQRGRAKVSKVQAAPDAVAALEAGAVCVFVAPGEAGDVLAAVKGAVRVGEASTI